MSSRDLQPTMSDLSRLSESRAVNNVLKNLDSIIREALHREICGFDLKEDNPRIVEAIIRKVKDETIYSRYQY